MTGFSIVQIGDTHLHQGPRQADRLHALDQIVDACVGTPPGLVVWPGDLFHHRSSVEDRNELKERVKRLADIAPLFICGGNHDVAGDLDIFGDLRTRHAVTVASTPTSLRFILSGNIGLTVFALPWPTEAGLVGAGVTPAQMNQDGRTALEAIFRDAAQRLTDARAAGDATLMIGHVNVAGAIRSSGQPAIGQEIEVDAALLGMVGDCPKLLNHVHKAQSIGGARGAHYAGSICRLDWGEVEPKGYNVATYEWREREERWAHRVDWHPLDVPPMWHVDGRLTRAGFVVDSLDETHDAEINRRLSARDWSGCDVRVRAKYRQSEGALLEMAQAELRGLFRSARRFELEPVCEPDRGLRSPEVASARTLAEKVAAWATVSGVTLPEDVAALAGRLDGEDGEALVADVAARMAALAQVPQEVTS